MRGRGRLQLAAAVAHGISAALSNRPLDRSWFDALCSFEEEVAYAQYEANANRAEAILLSRR